MPAYTPQQAQTYYNTLPQSEKAKVDASGGPSVEWLQNAVSAGVPDAIVAAGGRSGTPEGGGWEGSGGAWIDPTGSAPSSDWLGKRMPTPQEMRLWARESHGRHVGGDPNAQDEDYERYSDRQIAAWLNEGWDPAAGRWKEGYNPTGAASDMRGGGGGGGGGGYGGMYSSGASFGGQGTGTAGAPPQFNAPQWTAPTYEEAFNDPGYQFSLQQGITGLEHSAAAHGVLRTGGTLQDIIGYGEDRAQQQYGDVFNRSLQGFGANYQGAKDEFAPQYGAWTTQYGGDLSKYLQSQQAGLAQWQTQYGGDLSKYLQKENNIYGLINTPPPQAPSYGG